MVIDEYHMETTRYIKVCGDYLSSGLFDEMSYEQLRPRDLNLPDDLVQRLQRLVTDYHVIIPLMPDQLQNAEKQNEIRAIDARGIELTKDIAKFLGDKFKLRYYSEGMRKFIE